MAQTTQAKYDAAVKKYWKAKVDATMAKNNVTIKQEEKKTPTTFQKAKVGTVENNDPNAGRTGTISGWHTEEQLKPLLPHVGRADGNYTPEEIAQNKAADARDAENAAIAARRREARLKRQYQAASKKAWWSENLLRVAAKKYWVNSSQYRAVKRKVNKYEKPVSTVKENVAKTKAKPISTKNWLTSTQYNALVRKYGDIQWVVTAAKNQYGKNSSQAKKVEALLNNYVWWVVKPKTIRETAVITDASLKSPDAIIKWVEQSDYKWNSVVDYLKSINQKSSFSARAKLAKDLWMQGYTGSVTQNADLLNKVRNRKPWESIDNLITNSKVDRWELPESQREWWVSAEDQAEFDRQQEAWDQRLRDQWIDPETWEPFEDKKTEDKKIKASEKNLEALKKLRLSGRTDKDLLKRVENKFWKDSEEYRKLKKFMEENPLADSTEWIDSWLLEKTKEELDKAQIDALEAARDENIAKTAENFIKWSEVIAWNNEELQKFYKDMAVELQTFIVDNRTRREAALQRTKDSELNKVVGQIRATLARRWVKIGNIPPEQLIAMSGELWAEAMRRINEATTEMENAVADLTERKTAEINKLVETWLIKQGEADASIEQMRQLKEKMIADIKANFVTNTFKITQAAVADADTNKAETLNTISTFVTQLWISWAAQWVMEEYLDASDSVEALENMISDLNDVNSRLFKAVDDAAKAAQLSAEFKAKIELMKATKSSSSSSWASTTRKIGEATMRALLAEWVPNASGYTTYWELEAAMNANPELKEKITTAISKANAINVSDSDT